MQDIKKFKEENNGKYPSFTFPGLYPLFYLDEENNCLCPDCANKEEEYNSPIIAYDVNWENDSLYCDDCGKRIESAYGEEE